MASFVTFFVATMASLGKPANVTQRALQRTTHHGQTRGFVRRVFKEPVASFGITGHATSLTTDNPPQTTDKPVASFVAFSKSQWLRSANQATPRNEPYHGPRTTDKPVASFGIPGNATQRALPRATDDETSNRPYRNYFPLKGILLRNRRKTERLRKA